MDLALPSQVRIAAWNHKAMELLYVVYENGDASRRKRAVGLYICSQKCKTLRTFLKGRKLDSLPLQKGSWGLGWKSSIWCLCFDYQCQTLGIILQKASRNEYVKIPLPCHPSSKESHVCREAVGRLMHSDAWIRMALCFQQTDSSWIERPAFQNLIWV